MPVNPELAHSQWIRYEQCRDNGHLQFVALADKCDAFLAGEQWDPRDKMKLGTRPALTINKILPTISTLLGDQIQNRTEVLFRPQNGASAAVADALSKVWMQISQANQLPWVRSDVFFSGLVRGRGFFDVRLDFTDTMIGEVRITAPNSKNILIDPDACEYDPDTWADVIETKWLSPQDIEILYSKADAELLHRTNAGSRYDLDSIDRVRNTFSRNRIPSFDYNDKEGVQRNIRIIDRQYRKLDTVEHFVDLRTGDMRQIPDSWDRERIALVIEKASGAIATTKKRIKRIRWTTTADDVVLHDDWSPYRHFTFVPYFPVFFNGRTIGAVENLIDPQELLNKTSSQELHVVNTTANSGWSVEQDSLLNMSIEELELEGATTGIVLEYRKGATPPQKILPNQVPTGLERLSYKAEEHIKSISNVTDSMQGDDREDVAAKAIAYKQRRSSITHSKPLDSLERTDWLLARNVVDIVQEYYTEQRLITITHEDFTQSPESLEVNVEDPVTGEITNDLTIGEFDIVVTSSPFRASLEDSQFEQARAMREIGVPIPDSVLIENSRLLRRADILKQMEGDKESPEAQAAAALKQREAEATVAGLEADVANKHADAQLKMSRAQKEGSEPQGDSAELEKMRAELTMMRERHDMELQAKREELDMKRQEHEMKLELQRREHEQGLMLKAEQAARDAENRQRKAEQAAAAQRAQASRVGVSQPAETTL